MSAAEAVEGKTAIGNREYVESNIFWRNRVPNAPSDARTGYYGVQRGQLTANRMKKRGMMEHTRSEPDGQDDPLQERRVVDVLSHKDCLWLGSTDESSTCARAAQEHNESQRPASGLSTRVERSPQLPTVGNLTATPSTTPPPTKLTQAPTGHQGL